MNRRVLFWVLFLGGVLAVSFFLFTGDRNSITSYDLVNIGEHKFVVEIADTPESRAQGLSGRDPNSLEGPYGMLFLFDEPEAQSFWMKEMKFPIDIIWVRDGRVVGIAPNVPPPLPDTPLAELPLYVSPKPVDTVFEVVAGTAAALGITTGDKFLWRENISDTIGSWQP